MISTLELQQFRGLERVTFENLGRVNLIVGGNNTGKTSLLEALVLLHGDSNQISKLPTTFREQPRKKEEFGANYWKLIPKDDFRALKIRADQLIASGGLDLNPEKWFIQRPSSNGRNVPIISIDARGGTSILSHPAKVKLSVLATKQKDPGDISELFNQIAPLNPDNEAKLEQLLRDSIEPRLRRLRYAKPQGAHTHLVYVDLGEGAMLPFTQLGQAFARTLQVYCEIFANRPKILLIDEIENGLYYEGLEDYWKGLMEVLEAQDVQLFATTHSRECMEAAHRAAATRAEYPLRYLRLDRRVDDPAKIVGTVFGKEEMETAINFNREMR